MKATATIGMVLLAAGCGGLALAADLGNEKQAKAMLEKAVAEMKKDKQAALGKFNKPDGGFRDRDLYVFCATPDGVTTAHPTHLGNNMKAQKDAKGKAFGEEMFKVAEEGKLKQVAYMWPKPGEKEPSSKVSYVTKVSGQICGVGYYK